MPDEKDPKTEQDADDTTQEDESQEETSGDEEELTIDQAKARLAEQKKHISRLNAESAERRKKLEAFEKAEEERKQAELSEVEKAEAKAKAAEDKRIALEAENKTLKLQGAFETKVRAMKLEFANELAAADAFNALDREAVGDDFSGLENEIKRLVKDRAYYFGKEVQQQNTDGTARGKVRQGAVSTEVLEKKRRAISPL